MCRHCPISSKAADGKTAYKLILYCMLTTIIFWSNLVWTVLWTWGAWSKDGWQGLKQPCFVVYFPVFVCIHWHLNGLFVSCCVELCMFFVIMCEQSNSCYHFFGSTAAEHLLLLRMTHNIFSQKLLKCCLVCKMQPQFYLSNKPIYQYFDCPSDIFARTDFI